MDYKADVRIITTLKGFREIKNFADELTYNLNILTNTLKNPNIVEKHKDIVKLGWKDMYEDDIDCLKDCLINLADKDITYRAVYLGENYEDIDIDNYTSSKDIKKFIPQPSIIREFDDAEDERQLNIYEQENQNIEEMESD